MKKLVHVVTAYVLMAHYDCFVRYFRFLLVNVVFIFLVASTYWQLVRDLAQSPAKGLEKLAQALNAGNARHFFVSYVILQGMNMLSCMLMEVADQPLIK